MKPRSAADIAKDKQKTEERRRAAAAQPKAVATHPALEAAVGQLSRSLEEARRSNPCFKAWKLLHSDQGEKSDLLSPEAEAIFEQLQREDPADPLIWHHLAILQHGRAIEKHQQQQVCDQDLWSRGLQAWARVIKSQDFWDRLRERWQARSARKPHDLLLTRLLKVDLATLRQQLPETLLRIHFKLIIELLEAKKRPLAQSHFKLLIGAPFDSELVGTLKANLYRAIVGEPTVLCKNGEFADARLRVENYLALDPNDIKALLASVQIAVSEACSPKLGGDSNNMLTALERAQHHAENAALEQALRQPSMTLEKDLLRNFYRLGAEVRMRCAGALGASSSQRADELCRASLNICHKSRSLGGESLDFSEIGKMEVFTLLSQRNYSGAARLVERVVRFGTSNEELRKLQMICSEAANGNQELIRALEKLPRS